MDQPGDADQSGVFVLQLPQSAMSVQHCSQHHLRQLVFIGTPNKYLMVVLSSAAGAAGRQGLVAGAPQLALPPWLPHSLQPRHWLSCCQTAAQPPASDAPVLPADAAEAAAEAAAGAAAEAAAGAAAEAAADMLKPGAALAAGAAVVQGAAAA